MLSLYILIISETEVVLTGCGVEVHTAVHSRALCPLKNQVKTGYHMYFPLSVACGGVVFFHKRLSSGTCCTAIFDVD